MTRYSPLTKHMNGQKPLAEQMAMLNAENFCNESTSFADVSQNALNATCPAAISHGSWMRPSDGHTNFQYEFPPSTSVKPKEEKKDDYEVPEEKCNRTTLCQGFKRGFCTYGASCKFAHGSSELQSHSRKVGSPLYRHRHEDSRIKKVGEKRMLTRFSPPSRQTKSSRNRPVCRNFARTGKCKFGERCFYTHVERRPFVNPNATLATMPIQTFNPTIPPPQHAVPSFPNYPQLPLRVTPPPPPPTMFQQTMNMSGQMFDLNATMPSFSTYPSYLPPTMPNQYSNYSQWNQVFYSGTSMY